MDSGNIILLWRAPTPCGISKLQSTRLSLRLNAIPRRDFPPRAHTRSLRGIADYGGKPDDTGLRTALRRHLLSRVYTMSRPIFLSGCESH